MFPGRLLGTVRAAQPLTEVEGLKFLILQPMDVEKGFDRGRPWWLPTARAKNVDRIDL